MALVEYSDSEGSDEGPITENTPDTTEEKPSGSAPPKPGFKKVVDSSNSHKIRVNLPTLSNRDKKPDGQTGEERPVKRARTGGGFSDFNSLLPAPKNASASAAGSSSLLKGRATGLKQGISLKTGAAPAFSREPPPPALDAEEEFDFPNEAHPHDEAAEELQSTPVPTEPLPEIKTTAKPMMFKPLSVGKKSVKKKKPQSAEQQDGFSQGSVPQPAVSAATAVPEPVKPKRSLFSAYVPETGSAGVDVSAAEGGGDYQPLLDEQPQISNTHSTGHAAGSQEFQSQSQPQPQDINELADNLGLTAAQRRQLFGRSGKASGVEVAHFSVSEEYSNNNAMRASEENAAPMHNPVRAIAPGKHSLQQLLNAATSQKEALEESFATGKRNKQAAGSKYGW